MITLTTCRKFWADVRNGRIYSPEDGDPTFTQRIKRIRFCPRCRLQSAEALSIDCGCEFAEKERARGKVGTGINLEDGE